MESTVQSSKSKNGKEKWLEHRDSCNDKVAMERIQGTRTRTETLQSTEKIEKIILIFLLLVYPFFSSS